MRRLGVIGRADRSGFATQSLAVAQHMNPTAALVLDMEHQQAPYRGRPGFDAQPWVDALGADRVRVGVFPFTDDDLGWLLERSDVIFTVEGPPPGRDDFPAQCLAHGKELVIHVNPELWRPAYRDESTRLTLPTMWHADRFPDAEHLPMPVDRARFPFRLRTKARTFLHVAAPAFHDRNGSDIVRAALHHITEHVRFYIMGVSESREETTIGNVEAVFLPPVADHADVYPWDADVLVIPRRYGGQALCFNEAASLGMPVLTTDLEPQTALDFTVRVPTLPNPDVVQMIGGHEPVHSVAPEQLASAIDDLVRSPKSVEGLSWCADAWAAANSWDALAPLWARQLGL